MKKMTQDVARALYNLGKESRDFDVIVKWIRDSLTEEMYQGILAAQEPQRTWGQGRCQQLVELLGSIEGAEKALAMFRGTKN